MQPSHGLLRPQRLPRRGNGILSLARSSRAATVNIGAATSLQRNFTSSPPSADEPPTGLQEVLATLQKVRERKDIFQEYNKQNVFAPLSSLSWFANWLMFYHLNRPQRTQLDLVEFMEGPTYAMDATMTAMYSKEFADYVSRESVIPADLAPDCATAEMVHRSLETVSYDAFKQFLLKTKSAGIHTEMQEVEVHSAHLMSVQYDRIDRKATTNSSGAKVLGVPVEERLKLAVISTSPST